MNCAIKGCSKPVHARGWCHKHYKRWQIHGDPTKTITAEWGAAQRWLLGNRNHRGSKCLIWPFGKTTLGYAASTGGLVARLMCEAVKGPSPTPKHQTAHLCGNGHLGCVHPKHIRWATAKQNAMDRYAHGTMRNKLNASQVAKIRRAKGKRTLDELADRYGTTRSNISKIWRRQSWRHVP